MTHTVTTFYVLYSSAKNGSASRYEEEVQTVQFLCFLLLRNRPKKKRKIKKRNRQVALANILEAKSKAKKKKGTKC